MIRSLILLSLYSLVWTADKQPLDCSKLEKVAPGKNGPRRFQAKGDKFEEFDWEISKALNAAEPGNMVISPISLKVVLAMLYEGANGTTAQEIGNALDLTNLTRTYTRERFSTILKSLQTSKGEYEIKMGSHVFIDKSAQPKEMYLCKLQNFYNSFMETVDFKDSAAAVKVINNWASKVTEGHIQHLVSDAEAHSSTVMLLLNAIYFKGLWEVPFPENQTEPRTFYLNEKETVKVPMMNTTDQFLYSNIADLKARMIRLPYLGGKFSMYVMIPNSKDGLGTLINALGPNKALTEYFKEMYRTSVNLIMPKFEFVFTTSLRSTLEKLGMPTMFSQMAELTEIAETKSGGLIVSNIIQKAGISVTEIGTVAYAATVAELMDKFGGSEETEQFIIDRPFLFFIQDETVKTTVFVGKVTNPANAKVKVNPVMVEPPPQCNGADSCQINTVPVKKDEGQGGGNPGNPEKMSFFDAQLLKEVSAKESGNFVISPASIKTLLGMVMEGAESSTLTKLRTALRLPQDSDQAHQHLSLVQSILQRRTPGVIVDSHANVFVNKKYQVNTTYSKAIKQYYNADATSQDFSSASAAANNINNWVKNKTHGLIPTLIDEGIVDQDTLAVLVNAIYFDAKWKYEFMTADTADRCFYSYPALECQKIPMMLKEQEYNYKFDKALESHVVQIPYADENLSMLLVVPQRRDGIEQLNYDAGQLTVPRLVEGLRKHEVVLKLPRFTIEFSSQLFEVMKEMGLEELFTENAQLPHMMNDSPGRVSAMLHKAKIEVSEKGTKAAAASGAAVVPLMFGLNTIYLDVDHPFYYFIFEQETKTVLFSGRFSSAEGQTQKNNPPPVSQPPSSQPPASQQGTNKPAGNTGRFRKDATA